MAESDKDLVIYEADCVSCGHSENEVVVRSEEDPVPTDLVCPYCAAPIHAVPSSLVRWSAKKRAYEVRFTLPVELSPDSSAKLSAWLPVQVGEASRCECGTTLRVGDHQVQVIDGEVHFEGQFVCPRCNGGSRGALKRIGNALKSFWLSIKRVKAGPEGLEWETRDPPGAS